MEHRDGFFSGAREANIYYHCWMPEGEPRAVLLIVHGLAEHCFRYLNLANHFVPLGYAVCGFDHIGHGKSDGTRVHVERFEDLTETLRTYHGMLRNWYPQVPIFLVAHSLGGLIACCYLLDQPPTLAGAVISGPAVKVPEGTSAATVFLGRALSVLMPKFAMVQIDAQGVSRDPAVVQGYIDDPLVYKGKYTVRMAIEALEAMQRVGAEAGEITLPILILQGSADKIVDPTGAQDLYDGVSSEDKTIKVYDGLYHEVFNEPECDQVLSDVEAWLEAHLASEA